MADRLRGLETALLWVIRSGILLVPAVALFMSLKQYWPLPEDWHFPQILRGYIAWKGFSFRILAEVLLGLWVVLAVMAPRFRPRFSWVLVAVSAFVGVIAIADALGAAPDRSFWSDFERMQGLVGLLHLYAFFVVAGAVMDAKTWKLFFHVSLGVCALVCGYAIEEGIQIYQDQSWQGEYRIGGVFGSPVNLGLYALLHVFLAALWGFRAGRVGAKLAYAALALLFLVVIALTGTRAAWVGLLGGGALATGLMAVFGDNPRLRTWTLCGVAGAAALAAVFAVLAWTAPEALKGIPVLERISSAGERVALMFGVYKVAVLGFLDHPLLGYGQENFTYAFDRHYQPVFFERKWMWNDQPHNVFFKWLVEGGALGLLTYAGIWAAVLHCLWRRGYESLALRDKSIVTGLLAGYLIFVCVQLDEITSYILFFSVLGYVHTMHAPPANAAPRWWPPRWTLIVLAPAVVFATWSAIDYVNLRNVRAGLAFPRYGRLPRMMIKHTLAEDSFIRTEARETLFRSALHRWSNRVGPEAARRSLVELAISEFKKEIALEPNRVRSLYLMGQWLIRVGRPGEAVPYLEKACELAPQRPRMAMETGVAYQYMGRLDDALDRFESAQRIYPSKRGDHLYSSFVVHLARAHVRKGDKAKAVEMIRKVGQMDLKWNFDADRAVRDLDKIPPR